MDNLPPSYEQQTILDQPTLSTVPEYADSNSTRTGSVSSDTSEPCCNPRWQSFGTARYDYFVQSALTKVHNDLASKGSIPFTTWPQEIPKFQDIAESFPFVRSALLSFAVNNFVGPQEYVQAQKLHIHYSGIALRGLHDSLGEFTYTNADAVLAASLLMSWQATNWRQWSSLLAGVHAVSTCYSVVRSSRLTSSQVHATIKSRGYVSHFSKLAVRQHFVLGSSTTTKPANAATLELRKTIQKTINALQQLQTAVSADNLELCYTSQLLDCIRTIRSIHLSRNASEQFSRLCNLREFFFWAPLALLQQSNRTHASMLTLAHMYAAAITLEPCFSDLGPVFCSSMVVPAFEAVMRDVGLGSAGIDWQANTVEDEYAVGWPYLQAAAAASRRTWTLKSS